MISNKYKIAPLITKETSPKKTKNNGIDKIRNIGRIVTFISPKIIQPIIKVLNHHATVIPASSPMTWLGHNKYDIMYKISAFMSIENSTFIY